MEHIRGIKIRVARTHVLTKYGKAGLYTLDNNAEHRLVNGSNQYIAEQWRNAQCLHVFTHSENLLPCTFSNVNGLLMLSGTTAIWLI